MGCVEPGYRNELVVQSYIKRCLVCARSRQGLSIRLIVLTVQIRSKVPGSDITTKAGNKEGSSAV